MVESRRKCSTCKKEKIGNHAAYCRECYNAYKRAWYLAHRKSQILRAMDYAKNNPDRHLQNMRRYQRSDKAKSVRIHYKRNNPEKIKVLDSRKRVKRRTSLIVAVNDLTSEQWNNIKKSHDYKCHYCLLVKPLTMDHVVPISKGGQHTDSNIVPACRSCNSRKWNRDYQDFIKEIRSSELQRI